MLKPAKKTDESWTFSALRYLSTVVTHFKQSMPPRLNDRHFHEDSSLPCSHMELCASYFAAASPSLSKTWKSNASKVLSVSATIWTITPPTLL